jgi:hypothetical protein
VAVLGALDAVFRRFREAPIEDVNDVLDLCQKQAAAPVLCTAQARNSLVPARQSFCSTFTGGTKRCS